MVLLFVLFRFFVKVFLYVLALCLNMMAAMAYGSASYMDSDRWYIILSLWILDLRIWEMRCPSGVCSSTDSGNVGWEVISKDPVGTASKSGLIGMVV